MAKIVLSDAAPEDVGTFSLGNAEPFEAPYETHDRDVLANARAHPWLTVEADEVEEVGGLELDTRLTPAEDHLSSLNDHSNEPDVVRAENERRLAEFEERYAGTPEEETAEVETPQDTLTYNYDKDTN